MSLRLTDAELDLLTGEPPELWQLYVVIRQYMDYATGVVGLRRRLSYRGMGEACYVEPVVGRQESGAPSKDKIRWRLKRLVKIGLLRPFGTQPLVFSCPCADADKSVQNKNTTPTPHFELSQHTTPDDGEITNENNTVDCGVDVVPTTPTPQFPEGMRTTPPVSGMSKTDTDVSVVGNESVPSCPHEEIINLYHERLPMCPRVRVWNNTRRGYLRTRWREDSSRQTLDWWGRFFGYAAKSAFLTGKVPRKDAPPFVADLEWIVKPTNFAKILEGRYQ